MAEMARALLAAFRLVSTCRASPRPESALRGNAHAFPRDSDSNA
jgi:hypothetical protein